MCTSVDVISLRSQTGIEVADGVAAFMHWDQTQDRGKGLLTLDEDGLGVTVTKDAYVTVSGVAEVYLTPAAGTIAACYANVSDYDDSDINVAVSTFGDDHSVPVTGDGAQQYIALPLAAVRRVKAGSKIRVDINFKDGTATEHLVQGNLDVMAIFTCP